MHIKGAVEAFIYAAWLHPFANRIICCFMQSPYCSVTKKELRVPRKLTVRLISATSTEYVLYSVDPQEHMSLPPSWKNLKWQVSVMCLMH